MKRRIGMMLLASLIVAALLVPASPAKAQYATYNEIASWVAWFNVQDAYYRCTANVLPPAGFYWGSNCLMVPYYY